jgi:cyclic pyranopterin phosphate synthase
MKEKELTHFNKNGRAHMVDVGGKEDTQRIAIAEGEIIMQPSTIKMIKDRKISKGLLVLWLPRKLVKLFPCAILYY